MTRFAAAVALVVAVVAPAAVGAAAATLHPATLSGCQVYWDSTQARSHCTGGTGHHRPCGVERTAASSTRVTKCKPTWALPGTYAYVYPDAGYFFVGGFLQTKGT